MGQMEVKLNGGGGGEESKVSGSSSVFCNVQKGDPRGLSDPTDLKRPPLEPRFLFIFIFIYDSLILGGPDLRNLRCVYVTIGLCVCCSWPDSNWLDVFCLCWVSLKA